VFFSIFTGYSGMSVGERTSSWHC